MARRPSVRRCGGNWVSMLKSRPKVWTSVLTYCSEVMSRRRAGEPATSGSFTGLTDAVVVSFDGDAPEQLESISAAASAIADGIKNFRTNCTRDSSDTLLR